MGGMSRKPASFAPGRILLLEAAERGDRGGLRAPTLSFRRTSGGRVLRNPQSQRRGTSLVGALSAFIGAFLGAFQGPPRGTGGPTNRPGRSGSPRASRGSTLGYPHRMTRKRLTLAGPALRSALAILAPALATAADGQPNFTGTYTFVTQKSDDLRAKIAAAVGPDYTVRQQEVRASARMDPHLARGSHGGPGEADPHDRPHGDRVPLRHGRRGQHLLLRPRGHEHGSCWRQTESLDPPGKASRSSPKRRKPRARAGSPPSTRCSPGASRCSWNGGSSTRRWSNRSRCASPSTVSRPAGLSAGSSRPFGEYKASRALANGTGVSRAPRRATGASSHSKASRPTVAAISPPKPPVSGASWSTRQRPVFATERTTESTSRSSFAPAGSPRRPARRSGPCRPRGSPRSRPRCMSITVKPRLRRVHGLPPARVRSYPAVNTREVNMSRRVLAVLAVLALAVPAWAEGPQKNCSTPKRIKVELSGYSVNLNPDPAQPVVRSFRRVARPQQPRARYQHGPQLRDGRAHFQPARVVLRRHGDLSRRSSRPATWACASRRPVSCWRPRPWRAPAGVCYDYVTTTTRPCLGDGHRGHRPLPRREGHDGRSALRLLPGLRTARSVADAVTTSRSSSRSSRDGQPGQPPEQVREARVGAQRLVGGRERAPTGPGGRGPRRGARAPVIAAVGVARAEAGPDEADGRHVLRPRPRLELAGEPGGFRAATAPAERHGEVAERDGVPLSLARAAAGRDRPPVLAASPSRRRPGCGAPAPSRGAPRGGSGSGRSPAPAGRTSGAPSRPARGGRRRAGRARGRGPPRRARRRRRRASSRGTRTASTGPSARPARARPTAAGSSRPRPGPSGGATSRDPARCGLPSQRVELDRPARLDVGRGERRRGGHDSPEREHRARVRERRPGPGEPGVAVDGLPVAADGGLPRPGPVVAARVVLPAEISVVRVRVDAAPGRGRRRPPTSISWAIARARSPWRASASRSSAS